MLIHQQCLIELDHALERAERLFHNADPGTAGHEASKVLEFAKWMPTGVEVESRKKKAEELVRRCRNN